MKCALCGFESLDTDYFFIDDWVTICRHHYFDGETVFKCVECKKVSINQNDFIFTGYANFCIDCYKKKEYSILTLGLW